MLRTTPPVPKRACQLGRHCNTWLSYQCRWPSISHLDLSITPVLPRRYGPSATQFSSVFNSHIRPRQRAHFLGIHRMQDHIFSMIYVFNIWWNILNILQVDLEEIWGTIFGPEALSSGSYQIFIQITKTKKFGKYLKYFIKEQSNISKEIFSCACGEWRGLQLG